MRAYQLGGVLLAAAVVVAGCQKDVGANLNPAQVAEQSKASLQEQLKVNHPEKPLTVEKVDVVPVGGASFEGMATIRRSDLNTTLMLPVKVAASASKAVVTMDDEKLTAAMAQGLKNALAPLKSEYGGAIFENGLLKLFPISVQKNAEEISSRIQVTFPIEVQGDWYVGQGCMAHACSVEEAAWAINSATGQAAAIKMESVEYTENGLNFTLYGAEESDAPPPLLAWAKERGVSILNTIPDAVTKLDEK